MASDARKRRGQVTNLRAAALLEGAIAWASSIPDDHVQVCEGRRMYTCKHFYPKPARRWKIVVSSFNDDAVTNRTLHPLFLLK